MRHLIGRKWAGVLAGSLAVAAAVASWAAGPSFRSGTEVWVAAAAHTPGANSTFFITDVWIHAPGAAAEVDVNFLPVGLDQSNTGQAPIRVSVPAGGQLSLPDILGAKFGVTQGSGALRFAVVGANPPSIVVTSRTYNNAVAGTFGQFIPGIPAELAFGLSDGSPATSQQAIGILTDANYRTNVGVVNISKTAPASVTIEIRSRSGEFIGSVTDTFPAWTARQYNRIFDVIGHDPSNNARAIVRVTGGGGKVLAYASVVDNRTGDPIYIPGTSGQ